MSETKKHPIKEYFDCASDYLGYLLENQAHVRKAETFFYVPDYLWGDFIVELWIIFENFNKASGGLSPEEFRKALTSECQEKFRTQ